MLYSHLSIESFIYRIIIVPKESSVTREIIIPNCITFSGTQHFCPYTLQCKQDNYFHFRNGKNELLSEGSTHFDKGRQLSGVVLSFFY